LLLRASKGPLLIPIRTFIGQMPNYSNEEATFGDLASDELPAAPSNQSFNTPGHSNLLRTMNAAGSHSSIPQSAYTQEQSLEDFIDLDKKWGLTRLQHALINCHTSITRKLLIHNDTGVSRLITTPHICGERNCYLCYPNRVDTTFKRLRMQLDVLPWTSPQFFLKTHHVIVPLPKCSGTEYTRAKKRSDMQKTGRLARQLKDAGNWGWYAYEPGYDASTDTYKPHAHFMVFFGIWGLSDIMDKSGKVTKKGIRSRWLQICPGVPPGAVKVYFCKSFNGKDGKPQFRDMTEYRAYLENRAYNMAHYLSRRSSGQGLQLENVRGTDGKTRKDVYVASVPDETYLNVIKKSRVLNPFGKLHTYAQGKDGKPKRTHFPKVFVQLRERLDSAIAQEKADWRVICLANHPKDKNCSIPPPLSFGILELKLRFEQLKPSLALGDDQDDTQFWREAYAALCGEHEIPILSELPFTKKTREYQDPRAFVDNMSGFPTSPDYRMKLDEYL
jgi:hypothetical protein